MAVMRVEKNCNYTVMANYHLRDKRLSLKAKGLLSVMISLPAEWDYTLAGLAYISKEGVSAIRAAIQELEENGYVTRARLRNEAGQLGDTEYTIYEFPQNEEKEDEQSSPPQTPVSASPALSDDVEPVCDSPILENPMLEKPTLGNPTLDFPTLENPTSDNRTQLNKDISNTYPKKKEIKNTDTSNPYQSNIHPSIREAAEPVRSDTTTHSARMNDGFIADEMLLDEPAAIPVRRQTDSLTEQQKFLSEPTSIPGMRRRLSFDGLVKKIKEQIDYWDLIENENRDEIDNIVSIMVEVMSTKCEYFTISGKKYPADLVHQRYSQINCQTIEYVLDCIHKCGSDIRNIKQYLVATLFNAPATCDSYYGAAVRRDFEYLRR